MCIFCFVDPGHLGKIFVDSLSEGNSIEFVKQRVESEQRK